MPLVDALVVAAYLAAILFIGARAARARRPGTEDYLLAGRSLTLPTFVAALVTSFYGGVLGVGEYAYRYGLSNWVVQGLPYYAFALIYAVWLAGRVRAEPGMTIPDHIERAYGRPAAVLAALLVFLLANPADDVLMLGTLAHWLTGWRLGLCVASAALAAVVLLFFGGLRAEAWTGRLEFLMMFGGFALILPFAWRAAGSWASLKTHLPAAHLTATGGNGALCVVSWFFIALWTFVDPAFHQRVCAAADARTARVGIAVSVTFWFCFDFMTTAAGLYARVLLPDLAEPMAAFPALADRLLPPVVRGLFLAGVASSILAALGAKSFLAAVSLAKDGVGRLAGLEPGQEERWVRAGLVAASLLAAVLALALPSVVALWYTVGSTTIPGLLVLLVSAYVEPLRVGPRWAVACSLAGWLFALGAWALGSRAPFYPGLAASLAVWGVARVLARGRGSPHA